VWLHFLLVGQESGIGHIQIQDVLVAERTNPREDSYRRLHLKAA
jgi:hypothetical protein